ncbi:MAG: hypothetical protein QW041_03245 [Candidatus Pacearchaeota archaeon]
MKKTKKNSKKFSEISIKKHSIFSALNVALILMTLAFLIGTLGGTSLPFTGNVVRINEVVTKEGLCGESCPAECGQNNAQCVSSPCTATGTEGTCICISAIGGVIGAHEVRKSCGLLNCDQVCKNLGFNGGAPKDTLTSCSVSSVKYSCTYTVSEQKSAQQCEAGLCLIDSSRCLPKVTPACSELSVIENINSLTDKWCTYNEHDGCIVKSAITNVNIGTSAPDYWQAEVDRIGNSTLYGSKTINIDDISKYVIKASIVIDDECKVYVKNASDADFKEINELSFKCGAYSCPFVSPQYDITKYFGKGKNIIKFVAVDYWGNDSWMTPANDIGGRVFFLNFSIELAPACSAAGGKEYNTTKEICVGEEITGVQLPTGIRCCDGTVYELYDSTIETCPEGKSIIQNSKTYCEKGLKRIKGVTEICTNKGGVYYDKNIQNCDEVIQIEGFDCCKEGKVSWKLCEDTTRKPIGDLCDGITTICKGDIVFSGDEKGICCLQTCTYIGEWKTCAEMGYKRYDSSVMSCRESVPAADDTNVMKCCKVAPNSTTVDKSCAEQIKWLCEPGKAVKCPVDKWIPSTDDKSDEAQCCNQQCEQKKCSELSMYYRLCDLSKEECPEGKEVEGTLDSAPGSKVCCKAMCRPIISPPAAYCGNGIIDSGEECDGSNLGGKTCVDIKGREWIGNLKCVNCKYDISECRLSTISPGAAGVCTIGTVKVPLGYRTVTQYCDITGVMRNQREKDEACGNDYECKSNVCSNGKCTEVREVLALIPRIWCWLKSWIAYPADKTARESAICECEEDYIANPPEDFCD